MTGDLLGMLSPVRLRRVADRHGLGAVISVEQLGGSFGNNLALLTDRGPWVLRVAFDSIDPVSLRRERFFARLLHERSSIAVPWPYFVDESAELLGWPYALMPRLPGEVINPWSDVPWDRVGTSLGVAVAELHRVAFPRIARWDVAVDGLVPIVMSPSAWFLDRTRRLAEAAALDDDSAAFVESVARAGAAAIGEFTPTYVHGDLGVANLATEGPESYRVTGVFDLGGGYVGDPDEDLAIPVWWPIFFRKPEMSRSFLKSYRAEHPARSGEALRLRAYIVVSLLANWETGHRLGHNWYGGNPSFRDWARPLLDQTDEVTAR